MFRWRDTSEQSENLMDCSLSSEELPLQLFGLESSFLTQIFTLEKENLIYIANQKEF